MQVFALALISDPARSVVEGILSILLLSIPALLAGSTLGILAFRSVKEQTFRRIILASCWCQACLLFV